MENPDLRILAKWLEEIAKTIDNQNEWDFYTEGGNHLHVERHINENGKEVVDFIYNPGD
jgi:hypothetical protein